MLALVAAAACAWLALLVLAPLLPVPIAGVTYLFGSLICHQLGDRSFHLDGAQLPVCARCMGGYAGFLGAWVLGCLGAGSGVRGFGVHGGFTVRRSRTVLIAGAVPSAVTLVLEWAGVWSPSNVTRAAAGAALGASVAFVTLHYAQCARRRPVVPSPPPTPI